MIRINNHDIIGVYCNLLKIISVYAGQKLIWSEQFEEKLNEVLSCFYNGYWIDENPWTDDTPWID